MPYLQIQLDHISGIVPSNQMQLTRAIINTLQRHQYVTIPQVRSISGCKEEEYNLTPENFVRRSLECSGMISLDNHVVTIYVEYKGDLKISCQIGRVITFFPFVSFKKESLSFVFSNSTHINQ